MVTPVWGGRDHDTYHQAPLLRALTQHVENAALSKHTVHQTKTPSTFKTRFGSNFELRVSSFGFRARSADLSRSADGPRSPDVASPPAPGPRLQHRLRPGGLELRGGGGRKSIPRLYLYNFHCDHRCSRRLRSMCILVRVSWSYRFRLRQDSAVRLGGCAKV